MSELIIDNFAGGGGASCGIELATNTIVDIAINHDPQSIRMHKTNHPYTKHYCENVWEINPKEVVGNNSVALCWFSPSCTHFSRAKGNVPVDKNIRGLAWVALRWAATVKPKVIMLENVKEFQTWCPVIDGRPDIKNKGRTFNSFINALKRQGYKVEYKVLKACDYGTPTTRERFFMVARCDGKQIKWPNPTNGEGLSPYIPAKDIIDWSIPCKSIFNRKKPLSDNTLRRIAKGIYKFIDKNEGVYTFDDKAAVLLQMGYGDKEGKRSMDLNKPLGVVTAGGNKFGLASVTLEEGKLPKEYIKSFLIKYYGCGIGQSIYEPLDTVTTKDRFGLVNIHEKDYVITDISMRMLQPRELFNAQGFPDYYIIDYDYEGKKYPKSEQIARCGNAVPPPLVSALVRSNLPELCYLESEVI